MTAPHLFVIIGAGDKCNDIAIFLEYVMFLAQMANRCGELWEFY
jgi:hypothetical protein